jgi:Flp pilus assembly pilin Flp
VNYVLRLLVRLDAWLRLLFARLRVWARKLLARIPWALEEGQATAEYALVILAAAAVALVLIAWARSSGKLPAFFDNIIDQIINSAQ